MPKTHVPTVPNPVHIAYAVPSGSFFTASDKKKALKKKPITVTTEGTILEKPSEYFMAQAQTTSKTPATASINHSISLPPGIFIFKDLTIKNACSPITRWQ